ncbi:MAG: hypothetical protein IKS34_00120 [Clostridia bacterium]|nr:hypothetical protein [Clostridia bacterium]
MRKRIGPTLRRAAKAAALTTALICLLACCLPAYAAKEESDMSGELNMTVDELKEILRAEIRYIEELQYPNGAIPDMRPAGVDEGQTLPVANGFDPSVYRHWSSARMIPYFSDAAVLGVIRACGVLGKDDPLYETGKQISRKYLEWYISHMNTASSDLNGLAGTVYDYRIYLSPAGEVAEVRLHDVNAYKYTNEKDNPNDYDSTDSYAAAFLQLMEEYASLFDETYLQDKEEIADVLIGVIRATYLPKLGLTGAKPNYMVCYLMDNCEVRDGLMSAKRIYESLGKQDKADEARRLAEDIRRAVAEKMYDETAGLYRYGLFDNGSPIEKADLSKFYPQGACQLFPVLFGLTDPDDGKASSVYKKFCAEFCRDGSNIKNWSTGRLKDDTYPWTILLRAVVRMKDWKTAGVFIRTMNRNYVVPRHPAPYYCAEAGHLMTAIAEILPALEKDQEGKDPAGNVSAEISVPSGTATESETEVAPPEERNSSPVPWIVAGVAAAAAAGALIAVFVIKKKKKAG